MTGFLYIVSVILFTAIAHAVPICNNAVKDIYDYVDDHQEYWGSMTCRKAVENDFCSAPVGSTLMTSYCSDTIQKLREQPELKDSHPQVIRLCGTLKDVFFTGTLTEASFNKSIPLRKQIDLSNLYEMTSGMQGMLGIAEFGASLFSWDTIKSMIPGFLPQSIKTLNMVPMMRDYYPVFELIYSIKSTTTIDIQLEKIFSALFKGVLSPGVLSVTPEKFVADFMKHYQKFLALYREVFFANEVLTLSNNMNTIFSFYERLAILEPSWNWDAQNHAKVAIAILKNNGLAKFFEAIADVAEDLKCIATYVDPLFANKWACVSLKQETKEDSETELQSTLKQTVKNCKSLMNITPCKPNPSEFPVLYICPSEYSNRCPDMLSAPSTNDIFGLAQMNLYRDHYANFSSCLMSCTSCNYTLLTNWTLVLKGNEPESKPKPKPSGIQTPLSPDNGNETASIAPDQSDNDIVPMPGLATKDLMMDMSWLAGKNATCKEFVSEGYCGFKLPSGEGALAAACPITIQIALKDLKKYESVLNHARYMTCSHLHDILIPAGETYDARHPIYNQLGENYIHIVEHIKAIIQKPQFRLQTVDSLKPKLARLADDDLGDIIITHKVDALQKLASSLINEFADPKILKYAEQIIDTLTLPKAISENTKTYIPPNFNLTRTILDSLNNRLTDLQRNIVNKFSGKDVVKFKESLLEVFEVLEEFICPSTFVTSQNSPCTKGDVKRVFAMMGEDTNLHKVLLGLSGLFTSVFRCNRVLNPKLLLELRCMNETFAPNAYFAKPEVFIEQVKAEVKSCADVINLFGCFPPRKFMVGAYFCAEEWRERCSNQSITLSTTDPLSLYYTKHQDHDFYEDFLACLTRGPNSKECQYVVDDEMNIVSRASFYQRQDVEEIEPESYTPITDNQTTDEPKAQLGQYVSNMILEKFKADGLCNGVIDMGMCQSNFEDVVHFCPQTLANRTYEGVDLQNKYNELLSCVLFSKIVNMSSLPSASSGQYHFQNASVDFDFLDLLQTISARPNGTTDSEILKSLNVNKKVYRQAEKIISYIISVSQKRVTYDNMAVYSLLHDRHLESAFQHLSGLKQQPKFAAALLLENIYRSDLSCYNATLTSNLQDLECSTGYQKYETLEGNDSLDQLEKELIQGGAINCPRLISIIGCYPTEYTMPLAYYCLEDYAKTCKAMSLDKRRLQSVARASLLADLMPVIMEDTYAILDECSMVDCEFDMQLENDIPHWELKPFPQVSDKAALETVIGSAQQDTNDALNSSIVGQNSEPTPEEPNNAVSPQMNDQPKAQALIDSNIHKISEASRLTVSCAALILVISLIL